MTENKKQLINRLNRIIGQLEAIKKTIENTNENESKSEDCINTITQVKASLNGLKKFSENYVQNYLNHCLNNSFPQNSENVTPLQVNIEKIKSNLEEVIKSSFTF